MARIRVSARGLTAGLASDLPHNELNTRQSPDFTNLTVRSGFMRVREGLDQFANDDASNRAIVTLFSSRLEDDSNELFAVRSDSADGEIVRLSAGTWSVLGNSGVDVPPNTNGNLVGSKTDPWRGDTVLSTPILVNGLEGNIYLEGASFNVAALGGNKSRFVKQYLSRTILAYQDDSGIKANQVQMSAPATFKDFSGIGSNKLQLRDDEWPITGLSVNRLFTVYKSRSIVTGVSSGESLNPLRFDTLATGGVGLWAEGAIARIGDTDIFLGPDDFYLFSGVGKPQPMRSPIAKRLLGEVNDNRLRQVHAVVDQEESEVIFSVPTGANDFPTSAYVFNWRLGMWAHWTWGGSVVSSAAHSASLSPTWASITGTWAQQSQTWADLRGSSASRDRIYGDDNGRTYIATAGQHIDEFATPADITWFYELPDRDFEGINIDENNQPIKMIKASDFKVLDRVDIIYRGIGSSPDVNVRVSNDEGENFELVQAKPLVSSPGVRTLSFFGRASGQRMRVRIDSNQPQDVAIRDVVMFFIAPAGGSR